MKPLSNKIRLIIGAVGFVIMIIISIGMYLDYTTPDELTLEFINT